MKKLSLFSLVLVCALFSCKKSNSGSSGYHMTATIDSKSKNFNATPPIATNSSPGDIPVITITGILNTSTGESLMITFTRTSVSGEAFAPGTYTDTTDGVNLQLVYTVNLATQYYSGTATASYAESAGSPVKNHLKIVISSLDSKAIKGTFSGDLFANGDVSATPVSMVNGDFYAQIHQ